MKELLLFSKNLEKDFVNENKDYQSKIVLMKKVLMKKNIYPRKWGSGYNSSLKKVVRSIKTL